VKADGLAAGKGVILCHSVEESDAAVADLMEEGRVGAAGKKVVVEEMLEGEEASFLALVDGERILPLAPAQDHKAVFEGDTGPNTGGMGAYSPTSLVDEALADRVVKEVMGPAVRRLAEDGTPFRGVLYAGLMMTAAGPKVLEFNVRFGDPETQPLMMRVKGDLAPVLLAAAQGDLSGRYIDWDPCSAVCVVLASGGYPGEYETGFEITGLTDLDELEDVVVFHAGTKRDADARIVTNGGRVLGVTALGADIVAARERAYQAVGHLWFQDAHFRKDIGGKEIGRGGGS
jgi:phosphoribosylamine---glycine ligase